MFGHGQRIVGAKIIMMRRLMAQRGRGRKRNVMFVSVAAVPGSTIRETFALLTATGFFHPLAMTLSGFESSEA